MSDMKPRGRVLVVEDEPDLREILVGEIALYQFQIFEAGSGKSAQEILMKEPIDVVVTDIRLPGMGGLELLKWINSAVTERPAVIFISGDADLSEAEVVKLGARALFQKPFKVKTMASAIAEILDSRNPSL